MQGRGLAPQQLALARVRAQAHGEVVLGPPVDSRHAFSLRTHSLSCGNSSIVGTRRISILVPGTVMGMRLAHSTASSCDATSST